MYLGLRAEKYNSTDDIVFMSKDVQQSLSDVTSKITATENRYRETLNIMQAYEAKLKLNSTQIDDVLKHHGYMKIRDGLLAEMGELKELLTSVQNGIDAALRDRRKYEAKKKEINAEYYKLLLSAKASFGLSEIKDQRFENIKHNFKAGGSNKPIATVIWYMTLTKLKNKFNPSAIRFPLVFDSPNNAEMDDEKRKEVLTYLLQNATLENQMVISAIGFQPQKFTSDIPISVTHLSNDKYHLLWSED